MPTDADLAWCAGLFEGEGTVVYGASHKGPLVIKMKMVDLDVLQAMAERCGVGKVTGPYKPSGVGRKWTHEWRASGRAAIDLLQAMYPWLGERRRARIDEKIALWRSRPNQLRATREVRAAIRARRREGATLAEIGDEFGFAFSYVGHILTGHAHPEEKAADDAVNGTSTLTVGEAARRAGRRPPGGRRPFGG